METPHIDKAIAQCGCDQAKQELETLRESHYHLLHYLKVIKTQTDASVSAFLSVANKAGKKLLPAVLLFMPLAADAAIL